MSICCLSCALFVIDDIPEHSGHAHNKDPSAVEASEEHESTPSTQYLLVEDFTDPRVSTSGEVVYDLTDTPGKFHYTQIKFLLSLHLVRIG